MQGGSGEIRLLARPGGPYLVLAGRLALRLAARGGRWSGGALGPVLGRGSVVPPFFCLHFLSLSLQGVLSRPRGRRRA